MESADSELFDILFAGECLAGHEVTAVRPALAKLFRADESTLDKLFSGKPQKIKGAVDKATAQKYETAMASAGARAILRTTNAGKAPPRGSSDDTPVRAATGPQMTLAPPGSDVLRPEERPRQTSVAPATDHLSIAPTGERLGEQAPETASVPPAPDFDVAEVGSDLSDGRETEAPPAPDTSNISLREGELDLSDCAPAPAAAAAMDLDHLSVAEAGDDLIAEDEKSRSEAQAPDTSHLSLSDPDPA